MAALRAGVLALMLVPVGLAGCLLQDDGPPLSITIPPMGPGEAWTLVYGDGSARQWKAATRVSEQTEPVLDMFGTPVAAWVLHTETSVDGEDPSRAYESAIEAGTGAWLVRAAGSWRGRADCGAPGTAFESTGTYRTFPTNAARYDEGELVGDLGEGESRTSTVGRQNEGWTTQEERTFRAIGHTLVTTSAFGEPRDVPALNVEVHTKLTSTSVDGSWAPDTYEFSERRYYADGVRLPLKTYTMPDAPDRPELVHQLTSYTFGGTGLALTGTLETSQFDGRNPHTTFAPLGTTLDDRDLGLEFPQAEALAALARDPRGITGYLWLQRHPEAIPVRGSYDRDPQNGTYEWEWWFEDSTGGITAAATRQATAGVPLDTARAFAVPPTPGGGQRMPGAEGVEVAPLAHAWEVAQAFEPAVESWRRMEWDAWQLERDEPSSHRHGPRIGIAFLPHISRYEITPAPFDLPAPKGTTIGAFGPGALVDLETGGIVQDQGKTHSCAVDANWPWDP